MPEIIRFCKKINAMMIGTMLITRAGKAMSHLLLYKPNKRLMANCMVISFSLFSSTIAKMKSFHIQKISSTKTLTTVGISMGKTT